MPLTRAETELMITQTAAARKSESASGAGVVLVPSGAELCVCHGEDQDANARLITKLFNNGLSATYVR